MPEIFHSPDLIIQEYAVGSFQTHCYFLINPDTRQLVIIDPGDDGDFLSEQILVQDLQLQAIILTHGHFDHVGAGLALRLNFPQALLILPQADEFIYSRGNGSADYFGVTLDPFAPPTHLVTINEEAHQPQLTSYTKSTASKSFPDHTTATSVLPNWQWLALPGHTPGHLGLYHPTHHVLISGDTIFFGGDLGRTDFSYADLPTLQQAIKKNILPLSDNTLILPGHEELFTFNSAYRKFLTISLNS